MDCALAEIAAGKEIAGELCGGGEGRVWEEVRMGQPHSLILLTSPEVSSSGFDQCGLLVSKKTDFFLGRALEPFFRSRTSPPPPLPLAPTAPLHTCLLQQKARSRAVSRQVTAISNPGRQASEGSFAGAEVRRGGAMARHDSARAPDTGPDRPSVSGVCWLPRVVSPPASPSPTHLRWRGRRLARMK